MALPVLESTTLSQQSTNGTTLTVAMPPTRPDGDLYVCVALKDDAPDFSGIDVSWNEIHSLEENSVVRYHAWWWPGDSEPASYTLTTDNETSTAVVFRISGANMAAPINAQATLGTNGSGTANAPAATTDVDETLVLRAAAIDREEITATPATEDHKGITGTGVDTHGYGCSNETGPNPAGSTGTAGFTAGGSDDWACGTIAIAAAVTEGLLRHPGMSGGMQEMLGGMRG